MAPPSSQIVLDRHVGEEIPSLGDLDYPAPERPMRRIAGDILSVEADATRHRPDEAADRVERSGLAAAVRSEEGHDLAPSHGEIDAAQDLV